MSVGRSVGLFVVALAAACNGDDVPPDTAQSGTRLKLGWFEFEDGLRTWSMDIRDSKLDEPCRPVEWSDSVLRCTPQTGTLAFSDAACTKPYIIGNNSAYAVMLAARTSTT